MLIALALLLLQDSPTTAAQAVNDLAHVTAQVADDAGLGQAAGSTSGGSAVNYCQATLNSYGTAGRIGFTGSLDLSRKTFGLVCTGLSQSAQSFGMFTFGNTAAPANVPFGNGFACVYFIPGQFYRMPIQAISASGVITRSIVDAPLDFAPFAPGSRWFFQGWYRNPEALAGGAPTTFNTTDGLDVTFAP